MAGRWIENLREFLAGCIHVGVDGQVTRFRQFKSQVDFCSAQNVTLKAFPRNGEIANRLIYREVVFRRAFDDDDANFVIRTVDNCLADINASLRSGGQN